MSLIHNWQQLAVKTDEALRGYIRRSFVLYARTVCEMLTEDAAFYSKTGGNDERAYDRLVRLTESYREAAGLIDAPDVTASPNPHINELLTDIRDILTSRLRQFGDIADDAAAVNPAAEEKRTIIERALAYTTRQIEDQANQYPDKTAPEKWAALRGAFLLGNEVQWLDEQTLRETYVHYQDGLRFCLLGLDDLHERKAARFHTEHIEREWETLEALMRVQVASLEAAVTGEGTASRVSEIIREAYRQTPLQMPPRAGQASPCRPYEEFVKVTPPAESATQPDNVPDTTAFFEALREETATLFGQQRITFLKAAYKMQRMIGVEILIAEEAAALFGTAYNALREQEIETVETERQIINGITETMEIKIESLRESIQNFNGEGASLLQSFAKEKNDVTDEIKEAAYLSIREAWLSNPPTETDLPCFFARCQESESFAPYRADYEKHVNRYMDKMEKAAMRFKKEILLYEVCTYEEILTHSVSRLEETANDAVKAIAQRLHDTYAALEVLLRKNNITPIRPVPHDTFNGKEHEVLVAEKQEGFAKGEIIKLVGSGYRHNDRVLMRANVIAAR
ncbi:MAG: nucleotide exchange factor GrpE [Defluviitaleaceae bacterium]|nr:nucleotide exchange factor GrpE [Defluviitaleaceae bacterium]